MKISSFALGAVILSAGTTSINAFSPRTFRLSSPRVSVSPTYSSVATTATATKNTALFTATTTSTSVQSDLGLEYIPIAPFGKGAPDSNLGGEAKRVLGGKGANLAEMSGLGLSVPPGFTITTECCDKYCNDPDWNTSLPEPLWKQVVSSLDAVESEMKSKFGSPENPLLLSVRSGAAISMPGMVRRYIELN